MKEKIQKLYSLLEAWANNSTIKMISVFVIYAIFIGGGLVIGGSTLLINLFGLNHFTEIVYPMWAFIICVGVWIMFVLIGNRTIK